MVTLVTSVLESLPSIALELISEYIACCDPKRRSLHAFSLASRRCCSASTAQRFARVQLTVRGRKKIRDDLRQWSELLGVGDRFRHVRQLKIVGSISRQDWMDTYVEPGAEDEEELSSDDDFCHSPRRPYIRFWKAGPRLSQEDKRKLDEDWQSLARFISRLSGLRDVVYAVNGQVPRCVLSAIHSIGCRLHVHTFSLRSLFQPRDHPHDIDADEYALATSPCLYRLIVPCCRYDGEGNVNYNQEAVLHMVAGAAPRLTHVCMWRLHPGNTLALINARRTERPQWKGFFPGTLEGDREPPTAKLESLVLDGAESLCSQLLDQSCDIELSKLQTLVIRWWDSDSNTSSSMEALVTRALSNEFKSLHSLALSLPTNDNHRESLTSLLRHLNPLESLELEGFISNDTFKSLLHQHAKTLRKLKLMPGRKPDTRTSVLVLSDDLMWELSERFPNLEQVELPVIRTGGNQREVRFYHALSQLPRLKHAVLHLQYSAGPTEREQVDERGEALCQDLCYAHAIPPERLREAYINAAVDSSLALSIFRTLSVNGNLRRLKLLHPGSAVQEGIVTELDDIFRWIGRSWVCELDRSGAVVVRELDKAARLKAREELEYVEQDTWRKVWEDIWPRGTENWWESWKSFPLAE